MALAVKQFFDFRPHLPFRFEVEIFGAGDALTETLKYSVQSVKITGTECDTSKAALYLGNGYKTIPIFNIASRTLTITFEETDGLRVISWLDTIIALQRNALPYVVGIRVKEFNTRFNRIVADKYYKCVLSTYDEPAFSRTGGPGIVSVSATFNIMSEQPWSQNLADAHDVGRGKAVEDDAGLTTLADRKSVG